MKKAISILVLGTLLVGCKSSPNTYPSHIKDGSKVVIDGSDISLTKDDIYHDLLKEAGAAQIFDIALNQIADREIKDTKKLAEKEKETLAQYQSQMKDGIDNYAKQSGFSNGEEYIANVIRPNAKQELLKEMYAQDHQAAILKKYNAKFLKMIKVDSESEAIKIIDKSKSQKEFDKEFTERKGEDLSIVTNETTLVNRNIVDSLDKFTKDGIYSKAIKTTDNKYAVIYVYNSDVSKHKAEVQKSILTIPNLKTDYEVFYLKKYKFDVYDAKLREEVKDINKDYIG